MKHAHILDILDTGAADEWIIVGKGPSFDKEKVERSPGRVCCLNDTANVLGNDLCVMNDRQALLKLDDYGVDNTGLLAIAAGPHHFLAHESLYQISTMYMAEVAERINILKDDIAYFDLRTCLHKFFPKHERINAHESVYETALWILGHKGVKRIHTVGIDGGTQYHSSFGKRDKGWENVDLTRQFVHADKIIETFGMEVTAL